MRDETQHLNFGIKLINTIKEEQPELWTPEFQQHIIDLVRQAAELEYKFAAEVFPRGIFGMNAEGFRQYIEHIADRRLQRVGLPPQFNVENPFPWMSEAIDLTKEKNFFETRVTEYQTGGTLNWD
jgi:ribonucleoside-diphosphate reductase beta chain